MRVLRTDQRQRLLVEGEDGAYLDPFPKSFEEAAHYMRRVKLGFVQRVRNGQHNPHVSQRTRDMEHPPSPNNIWQRRFYDFNVCGNIWRTQNTRPHPCVLCKDGIPGSFYSLLRWFPKLDLVAIRIFDPRKLPVGGIVRGLFNAYAFTLEVA